MDSIPVDLFFFCNIFLVQQRKRALPQTSYVELAVVVDNLRVNILLSVNLTDLTA